MRVMRFHEFGRPDTLVAGVVPDPVCEPGEVLIDVVASSVNPADWKIGAGMSRIATLPFTPGVDFAGIIRGLGPGVVGFDVGDAVYGAESTWQGGGFAETMAVSAARIAPAPATLPLTDAAAVPLAALTAWEAAFGTDQANVQPGARVLIHGGAGGVGSFAVQLCVMRGAHVAATASSANQDLLVRLGAHQHIDYQRCRFEDVVEPVDVVIDLVGGDLARRSLPIMTPGGVLTSIASVGPRARRRLECEAAHRHVRLTRVTMCQRRDMEILHRITDLIDGELLDVVVSARLPLEWAARGLNTNRMGHTSGKTIITTAG